MDREELLSRLSRLRRAQVGNQRIPHKPLLLLLWLFGRFAAHGTTQVSYQEAEEPVSRLINDFGPAVTSPSRARQRAAMPFVTSSMSCGTATISAAASLARTFLVI